MKFIQIIENDSEISSLSLDAQENYLGCADNQGNVQIYQKQTNDSYCLLNRFKAHQKTFDYLKSEDIDQAVNQVKIFKPQAEKLIISTCNQNSIKLFKLQNNECYHYKTFENVHQYNINSIKLAYHEDFMISSDDLRIYLWDVQNPTQGYNLVDIKPKNIKQVEEVIVNCDYHPFSDSQFLYSTSTGKIKVLDKRLKSVFNDSAITLYEKSELPNVFSEIIQSLSEAQYSHDARYIYSRDFLHIKIWDTNMPTKPVKTIRVYDSIAQKLAYLYENDLIFEKFDMVSNHNHILTSNMISHILGNFNNSFNIIDLNQFNNVMITCDENQNVVTQNLNSNQMESLKPNFDFFKKISKLASTNKNIIASSKNQLYIYSIK